MSDLNEEIQERLLGFWRAYKFYIIITVLMSVSGAAGLARQSSLYEEARDESGKALFELLHAGEEGDAETARRALARIDGERFSAMRNLALASLAAAQNGGGDAEAAAATLREAAAAETETGLRLIIVLRLAEVLINAGKSEEALEQLNAAEPEEEILRVLFAERRGDAHFAAGDVRKALAEYKTAREIAAAAYPNYAPVLNIKIGAASSLPLDGAENAATK
ncbi:MAG: tetratricopeptide repeat protein [Betaproteobacteria bacterium]|nr:tetratricopeptide repeat protein [Betaproteobacteria bacterium]